MRKITVVILFLIVLIWLAIGVFWTGSGSKQITIPDNNSPILLPQETPPVTPTDFSK